MDPALISNTASEIALIDLGFRKSGVTRPLNFYSATRLQQRASARACPTGRALASSVRSITGGYDHNVIKFSFYPDIKVNDMVSLRLFGSEHAKNKVFSHVLTPDGPLDEAASWKYFEHFMRNTTVPVELFRTARQELLQRGSLGQGK